ncbi:putative RxLR effector [Phytophthora cinnamomi]|uniref:putative RxLR effector n=1 Tax=Phytophthora cinnamomi TaxID=4785 RepID=UPI003559DC4B|nr:putative RxLR effector [Phytophthora cinnamomi]
MTLPPAAATPSQRTRVVRGGLTWPSVRGARLLRALTSGGGQEGQESQELQEQSADDQFSADFPYELELCVPTAGHLALVLVRRPPGVQLKSPARSNTTPVTPSASSSASTSAPAAPRVVYVLDALPPSRRGGYEDKNKSRKNKTPGAQLPPQQVDELELLEELFAPHTRAAGGKEGSVLIKAPLLCARFDCRVVSIRFIRSGGSLQKPQKINKSSSRGLNDSFNSSSGAVGAAAPLRCVVAREDGMAYLWEWQADLFQWVFLNRLCFLENPNLKWTRPVAAFTTMDLPLDSTVLGLGGDTGSNSGGGSGPGSSGATDLVWWSTATKQEPKLKLRRLRFERATDALRATDVVVGSAFTPKPACDDIVKLLSSKLGLFAISKTQARFRRLRC